MIHGILYKAAQTSDYRQVMEVHHPDLVLSSTHQRIVSESFEHVWLAQAIDKTMIDVNHSLARIGSPTRAVITAWGRLDNWSELAQSLGFSESESVVCDTSTLILHAFLKWGDACVEHLFGDFCFAIYDMREKRLFCARDHMGIKPFYYYDSNDLFIFSSSLTLFQRILSQRIKPCMEWAGRFLLKQALAMDFEKTAYASMFKLPPAHVCSVTATKMSKTRYFSFHTNKMYLKSSEDYVEYYQKYLDAAVKQRVQVDHPLGSELSGGIDSSTVTAYAVKHYPGSLNDFHAFGFAHFEHEPKQMLRVSQHLNIPMTHVCCNNFRFKQDKTRLLTALGAASQHLSATNHEIFYEMAGNFGIRTLLSGFGGDEFVTSIHGHLYLHELLKNKQYLTLYKYAPGHTVSRALRVLKYLWAHRNNAGVRNKRMKHAYDKRWLHHVLRDEVVHTYALKDAWNMQSVFDYGYTDLDQFTLENRLAPFISTRTEECTLIAGTYGIEYRWPLLDVRLIQAFLSIPTSEKYYRNVGRYLHKRAITDVVPKNIVEQHSKCMGDRMTDCMPEQVSLNEDLHPALFSLFNQTKLFAQEKQLIDILEKNPCNFYDAEMIPIRHNIDRVNALDDWLKHYFPHGCDWAIS